MEIEATKAAPVTKPKAGAPAHSGAGQDAASGAGAATMTPDVYSAGKKAKQQPVRDDKRALQILERGVYWANKENYGLTYWEDMKGARRTAEELFRYAVDTAATADVAFLVGKVAVASSSYRTSETHVYGDHYANTVAMKLPPTPAGTMAKLSLLFPSLFWTSLFN